MKEIIDSIGGMTDLIVDGGPKAIISILIANFVLISLAGYFILKSQFNFIKTHNDNKDRILSEKDELINTRMLKMEGLIDQYNKLALQNLEKDNQIIMMINDLKTFILFAETKK